MFDFITNIFDIFTSIFSAVTSVFRGILVLVAWLVNVISSGFDYAYHITGMIPYQIFIIAVPCIAIVIAFNVINFVKGWL